jgi:hypothetical protein
MSLDKNTADPASAVGNAYNPAEHARVQFLDDSVRMVAESTESASGPDSPTAPSIELRLARFGRGAALAPLPPASEPVRSGSRVEYRRGPAFTEWYVNGLFGLEQGFTLDARPEGAGSLVFGLAFGNGLEPRLSSDGSTVELYTGAGVATHVAGRYSDLRVRDARGQALEARFQATGKEIAIVVNDEEATYPIVVDPLLSLQGTFEPPNAGQFGFSVALEGDTAIVAAPSVAGGAGAVYAFTRTGFTWSPPQTLLGATADILGTGLALSGNTLLVGASGNNRAYVYTRSSASSPWSLAQQLVPHDGASADFFGFSVAIGGNALLIGAPGKASSTGAANAGAAYVFANTTGTWQEQAELSANDGMAQDLLGISVTISSDGNMALVGAPSNSQGTRNGAYFYTRSGTTWTQFQKVSVAGGSVTDSFGSAVALVGPTAVIGARGRNSNAGAVFLYVLSNGTWDQLPELDGVGAERFGTSVAFDGTTAIVGAVGSLSAYPVTSSSGVWSKEQPISSSAPGFGQSVSLSGTATTFTVLVGATLNGVASDPGAAFVFVTGSPVPALSWKGGLVLALAVSLGGILVLSAGSKRRVVA